MMVLPATLDLQVGNVTIKASGAGLDLEDTVQVDGVDLEWIDKVTVVLSVNAAARVTVEGPAYRRKEADS